MSDACGCPSHQEVGRAPPHVLPAVSGCPRLTGPSTNLTGRQEGSLRSGTPKGERALPSRAVVTCASQLGHPPKVCRGRQTRWTCSFSERSQGERQHSQGEWHHSDRRLGGDPAPTHGAPSCLRAPGCHDRGPHRAILPSSCPHTSARVCPCVGAACARSTARSLASRIPFTANVNKQSPPPPAPRPRPRRWGPVLQSSCVRSVLARKVDKARATGSGQPEETDGARLSPAGHSPHLLAQHRAPSARVPAPSVPVTPSSSSTSTETQAAGHRTGRAGKRHQHRQPARSDRA